jgi:hypothetical protein
LVIPGLSRNLPERSGTPLGTVVLSDPLPRIGERFLDRLGVTTEEDYRLE